MSSISTHFPKTNDIFSIDPFMYNEFSLVSELYVIYTVAYTVYIVHCTLYIVQCILYSVHCTLYTVQWSIIVYNTSSQYKQVNIGWSYVLSSSATLSDGNEYMI